MVNELIPAPTPPTTAPAGPTATTAVAQFP